MDVLAETSADRAETTDQGRFLEEFVDGACRTVVAVPFPRNQIPASPGGASGRPGPLW